MGQFGAKLAQGWWFVPEDTQHTIHKHEFHTLPDFKICGGCGYCIRKRSSNGIKIDLSPVWDFFRNPRTKFLGENYLSGFSLIVHLLERTSLVRSWEIERGRGKKTARENRENFVSIVFKSWNNHYPISTLLGVKKTSESPFVKYNHITVQKSNLSPSRWEMFLNQTPLAPCFIKNNALLADTLGTLFVWINTVFICLSLRISLVQ